MLWELNLHIKIEAKEVGVVVTKSTKTRVVVGWKTNAVESRNYTPPCTFSLSSCIGSFVSRISPPPSLTKM